MKSEMERVHRPRGKARESYNSMSRWYDLFTGSEKRFTDIGIQMLNIQPNESILEVGCGTGHALIEFANKIENGRIIAIDLSEGMLKAARWQIRSRVQKRSVGLCQGDGLHIPFPNDQFDAVFLSFTLELFDTSEIPLVLNECHRILKTEGRIGVVALAKQDTTAVRIYEWFHKQMPILVDCRPIYAERAVSENGFSVQRSTIKTMWGLPVEIVVATKKRLFRRNNRSSQ
jgi:demethylmenaquinone methyltransferase/2-methoxy-6-polyprenyl-1,4-benzoquinol methylase